MKKFVPLLIVSIAAVACDKSPQKPTSEPPTETVSGSAGADEAETDEAEVDEKETADESEQSAVEVVPLQHGSLLLKWDGKVIAIDPVSGALEAADGEEPKADIIFVTHIHGDHLDPAAIATLRKEGAPVVVPQSVADEAGEELADPTVVANGDETSFLDGAVGVEVVAMYNLKRKRDSGEFFHPKGRGNGYVLTLGDERVYVSGDTECTPEMKALEEIDIAFVCMNLPYTMPPEEAAECIREFEPGILYPYHYRGQDPSSLTELLGDDVETTIELLEWYPGGE